MIPAASAGFTRNGSPPYTALTNAASRHGLRASSGLLVVIVEAAGRQTRGCWSSYPHRGAVRIRPIGASTPLWTESTTIPRRRRASRAACGVRRAPRGVRGAACTTRHAARGTWHAPTDDRPHSVQIHCISCIQTAFWDIASRTMPSETRSIRERPDASAKCTPPRHRKRWRGGREDPSAPPTQSAPGSRERSAVHRLHVHGTHVQRAHVDRAERAAALVAEGRDRGIVVATLDHGTEVTGLLRVVAVVVVTIPWRRRLDRSDLNLFIELTIGDRLERLGQIGGPAVERRLDQLHRVGIGVVDRAIGERHVRIVCDLARDAVLAAGDRHLDVGRAERTGERVEGALGVRDARAPPNDGCGERGRCEDPPPNLEEICTCSSPPRRSFRPRFGRTVTTLTVARAAPAA